MQLTKYVRKGKKVTYKLEVTGYFVALTPGQLRDHSSFNKAVLRDSLNDKDSIGHVEGFAPLKKQMTDLQWNKIVNELLAKVKTVKE
jgi:hypothetical protein